MCLAASWTYTPVEEDDEDDDLSMWMKWSMLKHCSDIDLQVDRPRRRGRSCPMRCGITAISGLFQHRHTLPSSPALPPPTHLLPTSSTMGSLLLPVADTAPPNYKTPEFPSLYLHNLFTTSRGVYLYHTPDIWRFTFYWTLIFFGGTHSAVAAYAVAVYLSAKVALPGGGRSPRVERGGGVDEGEEVGEGGKRKHKHRRKGKSKSKSTSLGLLGVLIPSLFIIVWGMGQAIIAGSIVGGLLGAVYEGGGFRMSTWIPVVWGGISTLIVVMGSFNIQGGM